MMNPWTTLAVAFVLILILNIVIRLRVLKLYRTLVNARVDFEPKHFFNPRKLKEEILPKYPDHREQIIKFVGLVRFSMTMASIIIVLIIIFGYTIINA